MMIRWGIAGPGKIAHKFASDLMSANDNECVAVASRSQERAIDFAEKFDLSKAYASYEELFADKDIDIIYIATPHHRHAELSIKALLAGKHVLCEKPAAINKEQMIQIAEVAQQTGCFFMEGLWTRFSPAFRRAMEIISRDMSPIKYINADFCFSIGGNPSSRLVDPLLAGGALLDIGIYPIFLSYILLGMPDRIVADGKIGPTGVDSSSAIIFSYPGAYACLFSSFELKSIMDARIYGADASLVLHDRWHELRSFRLIRGDDVETFEFDIRGNGFVDEIEECYNCIKIGRRESSLWSIQDSINLISLLDEVRKEIGLEFPFE